MAETTTDARTLPRETLDALEALERLVRRYGAVKEHEALVAIRALVPEDTPATLDDAFAIAHAARPKPVPKPVVEEKPAEAPAPEPAPEPSPAPPASEAPADDDPSST